MRSTRWLILMNIAITGLNVAMFAWLHNPVSLAAVAISLITIAVLAWRA